MASPRDPVQNNGPCPMCGSRTAPMGATGKRRCQNDGCELKMGYLPSDFAKADSGYSERDIRIAEMVTALMRGTATLGNGERKPMPLDYAAACRAAPALVDRAMAAEMTPEGGDESGGGKTPPPPVRQKPKTQSRQFATLKRGERPDPEWAREMHIKKAEDACRAASAADPAEAGAEIRKPACASLAEYMESVAKRS